MRDASPLFDLCMQPSRHGAITPCLVRTSARAARPALHSPLDYSSLTCSLKATFADGPLSKHSHDHSPKSIHTQIESARLNLVGGVATSQLITDCYGAEKPGIRLLPVIELLALQLDPQGYSPLKQLQYLP